MCAFEIPSIRMLTYMGGGAFTIEKWGLVACCKPMVQPPADVIQGTIRDAAACEPTSVNAWAATHEVEEF